MPRHPMPYVVDSEGSPSASPASSLKHSPSKRDKVRKFLRRVSSIGQRNKHDHDQSLSHTFAAAETQASGSERGAPTPEPHTLIDLTAEPTTPAKVPRRASTSSSVIRHTAGRLTADDGSSFHSSSPSESSAEDALSHTSAHKQHATRCVFSFISALFAFLIVRFVVRAARRMSSRSNHCRCRQRSLLSTNPPSKPRLISVKQ